MPIPQCFLKTLAQRADGTSVADANLFPDEAGFSPRPAWQVIEAARRRYLTGELTLPTTPATRIFLRDGLVYFAERSSDGTLPIRLMVEGVITREQMQRGTVIVNGVEHVGRMFDSDPSIDRASVELCVELFTDDVMVSVANEVVPSYEMTLYRRHPSGIDRWYPHSVPVTGRHGDTPDQSAAKRATSEAAAANAAAAKPKPRPQRTGQSEAQHPKHSNPHHDEPTERQPDVQPAAKAEVRACRRQPEPAARTQGRAAEQPQRPADHAGRADHGLGPVNGPAAADHAGRPHDLADHDAGAAGEHAAADGADSGDRSKGFNRSRCGSDRRRSCRGNQACLCRHGLRPLVHSGSSRLLRLAAPAGEEVAEQLACFLGTNSGHDGRAMIEPRVAAHLVQADQRTGLRVDRTEHHSPDSGVDQRAGAHHAWLQRDVERTVEQPPVPDDGGGIADRQHLGVCGGVTRQLALVVPGGDHLAVAHHDGADRHVAVGDGRGSLVERQLHRIVVGERCRHSGGGGIRTHGGLPLTRFPSVPIRPLSHPSRGREG